MLLDIKNTSEYLKSHAIKPSYQRINIFNYLKAEKTHPTVDNIYQEIVKKIPTLSKTTVYNTLNLFVEKGIVIRILVEENETRYDADTSLHAHFKCEKCEKVYDMDIDASKIEIEGLENFQINEHHLYFKGVCQICLKELN